MKSPYHWTNLDFLKVLPENQLKKPETNRLNESEFPPEINHEPGSDPLFYRNVQQLEKKTQNKGIIINGKGSSGEMLKYTYTLLPELPKATTTSGSTSTTPGSTTTTTTSTTTTTITTTTTTNSTASIPITKAVRKPSRKPIKFHEMRKEFNPQIVDPDQDYEEKKTFLGLQKRSGAVQFYKEKEESVPADSFFLIEKSSAEPSQFARSGKHIRNREPLILPRSKIHKKEIFWSDELNPNLENEVSSWKGRTSSLVKQDELLDEDDKTPINPMEIKNPFGQTPYNFEDFLPIPKIIPFNLFKNNFIGFPPLPRGTLKGFTKEKKITRIELKAVEDSEKNEIFPVQKVDDEPENPKPTPPLSYAPEEFVYQLIDDPTLSDVQDGEQDEPNLQKNNSPQRFQDSSKNFFNQPFPRTRFTEESFENGYLNGLSEFGIRPVRKFRPSSVRYPPILRSSAKQSLNLGFSIPSRSPEPDKILSKTEPSTQVEVPPRYLPENKIIKATFFEDMENGSPLDEPTRSSKPALSSTTSQPQLIRPDPGHSPPRSPPKLVHPEPGRSPASSPPKLVHPELGRSPASSPPELVHPEPGRSSPPKFIYPGPIRSSSKSPSKAIRPEPPGYKIRGNLSKPKVFITLPPIIKEIVC